MSGLDETRPLDEAETAHDHTGSAPPGGHDPIGSVGEAATATFQDRPGAAGEVSTFPGGLRTLKDGRYELEEPLATGGAAVVWRAYDTTLSRTVAVKMLHAHLAADPTTTERFRRESLGAARVLHPNVVTIYDSGRERDLAYLVMEHVDGPNLKDVLAAVGALPPAAVAALGEQVASALGEAHRQGLVHRDVKPANILIGRDGQVKVTDFGIAKALASASTSLTRPGTVLGTAAYVAPEVLRPPRPGTTPPPEAAADVYALGLVLHECLTGQPAYRGETPLEIAQARLTADVVPPRRLRADVPRVLDEVVVRATQRDPEARFADGRAMAQALQPLVESRPSDVTAALATLPAARDVRSGPVSGPLPTTQQIAAPPSPLLRIAIGALVLAVLGVLAVIVPNVLGDGGDGAAVDDLDPVAIATARDFDPFGQPPQENGALVPLAHDGDESTGWRTERYRRSPEFGNLKPGVGVWFDLGRPVPVATVEILLETAGSSLSIYALDRMPDDVDVLFDPESTSGSDLGEDFTAELPSPVTGRYWLVWFTRLGPVDDGAFQAGIREVRFSE